EEDSATEPEGDSFFREKSAREVHCNGDGGEPARDESYLDDSCFPCQHRGEGGEGVGIVL
ncbi:hypothetical protein J7L13_01890, partial [bacterium]|nr:hypothetical protein [bacterium]